MAASPRTDGKLIAYFSAEYGLTECLPIYSGGLGVLSGDHLKSSSDSDLPLVGVGLLYQQGYFRQLLNPDGWQQERYPTNDFYTLPARSGARCRRRESEGLRQAAHREGRSFRSGRWRSGGSRFICSIPTFRRTSLPQDRGITDSLYGGDTDTRMRQEFVLGIGGLRALKAMGLEPTVYHMNEGHSAFLALERIRVLMREHGLTFEEALEATRASNVFTTHTPVPAGIDLFDPGLMYHYFNAYCTRYRHRFRPVDGAGTPQSGQSRRALLHGGPGAEDFRVPQRGQQAAPRSLAGNVARSVAAIAGLGGADHFRDQRRAPDRVGSTATWRRSTISICSRTGASASATQQSGSR